MSVLHSLVRRLEGTGGLDRLAKPLTGAVGRLVRPRFVRNVLSGTYLGHPLHPMLTDVPLGAWTMSALLDIAGGTSAEGAADLLVRAGIIAALPTAASGLSDWSDTYGPETRVGLVHAAANTTALGLYVLSARARARGKRRRAKRLGFAGLVTVLAGGYLGGHLSFVKGVNVNRTAWEERPTTWTVALSDAALGEGEAKSVQVDRASVFLCRLDGRVRALASTCSHMGGPLEEGTLADGCVTCPWHGSIFRLDDGGVVRGPATTPQPVYETRVADGLIEVRATS
ncbi:MAG: Rieske (2Fe-2S) protein [Actinomycetota bacterium]|nr:Rieske (2Fe-2S) protein [Actinomycetota bacterium]